MLSIGKQMEDHGRLFHNYLQREGMSLTFRTETHKGRNVSSSLVLHWKSSFCVFCPPMLINESYANCGKSKKHKIENEVGQRSLIISRPRDTRY